MLAVAADIRVAATHLHEEGATAPEPETLIAEWMKSVGSGVPGYVTPKVAVGAVVGDDEGRMLLVQRADSGIWLYPTGWADVGYSASEVAVKEVHEETGIECEVVRLIAVLDGLRLGFTRVPLYSLVFHCRAVGGDLAAHPLETTGVGFFGRDELPEPLAGFGQWGDLAFAAIRGEEIGRDLRRTEREAVAWLRSSGRRWPSWPTRCGAGSAPRSRWSTRRSPPSRPATTP